MATSPAPSTRPDVLPGGAAEVIGGRVGRHVNPVGWWRLVVAQLMALVSVPMAAAVFQREHCVRFGWLGDSQFFRACFSDLPAQYAIGHLDGGLSGYVAGSVTLDQPVFAGTVMSALGGLVPAGSALDQSRWYFLYWVALATVLLVVTVWCTAHLIPDDLQAAAQVALSPIIVLAALLSSDALAVALVAGAMLAWKRERLVVTGILLGLGALTRGYVVLVVLALLLASVRSDRLRAAVWVAGAALASATAYALVFLAIQPGAFTASYTSWWQAKAGYGSPWLFPTIGTYELPSWSVTALAVIGITVALMLGWIFARDAVRPATWAQVSFVVVAVAMMTAKAVPVQASLWLLPLAAAAGVRWRDHLIWVGTELAHFIAIWLYVGALTHADRALPGPWYAVFLLVRLAGISYLVWRVWESSQKAPGGNDPRSPVDNDWLPTPGTVTLGQSPRAVQMSGHPREHDNPPVTEGP